MADVYNRDLRFDAPLPYVAYSTAYVDPNSNQWRVDVSGLPAVVMDFLERKPLKLEAVPLTQDQYSQLVDKAEHKFSLDAEAVAHPVLVTSAEESKQQTPDYESDLSQGAGARAFADPAEAGPPAFVLTLTLVKLQNRGPHLLVFELDPPITQTTSPQTIYFSLWGSDVTPNVSCFATRGSVWFSLVGGSQNWAATVFWSSGAPGYYVLRGDVVRN